MKRRGRALVLLIAGLMAASLGGSGVVSSLWWLFLSFAGGLMAGLAFVMTGRQQ